MIYKAYISLNVSFPLPQMRDFFTVFPKNNRYEIFLFDDILRKLYKCMF